MNLTDKQAHIKTTSLRPGNLATLSNEKYAKPLTAIEVVPGTVHFEGREECDDETDIVAFPITPALLIKHQFASRDFQQSTLLSPVLNPIPCLEMKQSLLDDKATLQFIAIKSTSFAGRLIIYLFINSFEIPRPFFYMHELQNIFFLLTGIELIEL